MIQGLYLHGVPAYSRTSDIQGNSDVKVIWECLPFNHSKLSKVIAMVGGIYNIGVLQLTQEPQFIVHLGLQKI